MLQALVKLEDCYSFGSLTGAQGFAPITETMVSGALGPDNTPMDLDSPQVSGCSVSSCPDSGTEDSDLEDVLQMFLSLAEQEDVIRRTFDG